MINFIIINTNRFNSYILILVLLLMSCEKLSENRDAVCSFQNLICDQNKENIDIKNVETFLLFGNPTDDTIKISLKEIQENYRHVYEKDTLGINFEALTPISIPPHDSLGLPCMSVVVKIFNKKDNIFKEGFHIVNIKSRKTISKVPNYTLKQIHDFQLYKKWGRKNGMTL